MSVRSRRLASLLAVGAMVASTVLPASMASAVTSSVEPTWVGQANGGPLGFDNVQFVRTSWAKSFSKPGEPLNGQHLVYVAGTAQQPANSPRTDRDVLISAFDAFTGEQVWSTRFDCGTWRASDQSIATVGDDRGVCLTPGTDDELVAFDIRSENINGHFVVNVNGQARWQSISLRTGALGASAGTNVAYDIPGMTASDMDTIDGTRNITVGTKGGKFAAWQIDGLDTKAEHAGPTGYANDVMISRRRSNDDAVATGYASSSQGGGIHTALFNVNRSYTLGQRWSRTWESAHGRKDEGIAATQGRVEALAGGAGWVSFVAGRSWTGTDWDIVVLAYDNRPAVGQNAPLWVQTFKGDGTLADSDDQPVDITWDHANQRVVVAGTTEQGSYDQNAVLLTYDGATGASARTQYVSGNVANGDDAPIDVEVHPTRDRIVLLAKVSNFFPTPTNVTATLAFDGDLRPAGAAIVSDQGGGVLAGGIAFLEGTAGDDVVAGVKAIGPLGDVDQTAVRLPVADFVVQTVATVIDFTDATDTSVVVGDVATLQARLTENDGSPIAGEIVQFGADAVTATAVTDTDGLATVTIDTSELDAGMTSLTADFAGRDIFSPSQAVSIMEVARLTSAMSFTDGTTASVEAGEQATVSVRLIEPSSGDPLSDRWVDISFGTSAGSALTDVDGVASASFATDGLAEGAYDVVATYAGDQRHEGSNASTTISVSVPEPSFVASSTATKKGVTLRFAVDSDGQEQVDVTFDLAFFDEDREHLPSQSPKERAAEGVRDLTLVVESFVDEAWVTIHTAERPGLVALDGGQDWAVAFEAVDAAGQYRARIDGTYVDADGNDLNGRGVKVVATIG